MIRHLGEGRDRADWRCCMRPTGAWGSVCRECRPKGWVPWGGLFFRTLGALLFTGAFLNVSWAEDNTEPVSSVAPFMAGAEITSQLDYSCPCNTACSFVCPSGVGVGGVGGVQDKEHGQEQKD